MEGQQAQQKLGHDRHAREHKFRVGQRVMVKGRHPQWLCGIVTEQIGPVTFLVDSTSKVHVDQMKELATSPLLDETHDEPWTHHHQPLQGLASSQTLGMLQP